MSLPNISLSFKMLHTLTIIAYIAGFNLIKLTRLNLYIDLYHVRGDMTFFVKVTIFVKIFN